MKSYRVIITIIMFLIAGKMTSRRAYSFYEEMPQIRINLPQQNVMFDDLDFRDELNRPIVNYHQKQKFISQFNQRVQFLLINNLTQFKQSVFNSLCKTVVPLFIHFKFFGATALRWMERIFEQIKLKLKVMFKALGIVPIPFVISQFIPETFYSILALLIVDSTRLLL